MVLPAYIRVSRFLHACQKNAIPRMKRIRIPRNCVHMFCTHTPARNNETYSPPKLLMQSSQAKRMQPSRVDCDPISIPYAIRTAGIDLLRVIHGTFDPLCGHFRAPFTKCYHLKYLPILSAPSSISSRFPPRPHSLTHSIQSEASEKS